MRLSFVIAVLLIAGSAQAGTLTVCHSGCDYSSIQAAIDAARPGDIIDVHSGAYNEEVNLNKDVTLRGIDTGSGTPSIGFINLCDHPKSSVSGFTYGVFNSGWSGSNNFAGATITVGGKQLKIPEKRVAKSNSVGVGSAQAATLTVCPSGCEYSSIQAAVDAASSGDIVKVFSGEYNGDVHTKIPDLSIVGVDTGSGAPIINGALLNDKNIKISGIIVTGGIRTGKASDNTLRDELRKIDTELEKISQTTKNVDSIHSIIETENKTPSKIHLDTPNVADRLIYTNNFSNCELNFYDNVSRVFCKNGKLHIAVPTANKVATAIVPEHVKFGNFIFEVETTQEQGVDDNEYGVILRRIDENNLYRFKISSLGYYGFDKRENGIWKDIIAWTKSSVIHKRNASNLLKVESKGCRFTFYVNGIEIGRCSDCVFASGEIGLTAGTGSTGDIQISFSNMKVFTV